METKNNTNDSKVVVNKKKPKDDILSIVKQFVSYFEEVDRSEKHDYSKRSS